MRKQVVVRLDTPRINIRKPGPVDLRINRNLVVLRVQYSGIAHEEGGIIYPGINTYPSFTTYLLDA